VRQRNPFLGAARNAGVRESSGRAVLFLDDDNIALPDMCTLLATAISNV
jgi:glycosyltransferase involved in cell wall biosynthesis